jgi:hypothetical protein
MHIWMKVWIILYVVIMLMLVQKLDGIKATVRPGRCKTEHKCHEREKEHIAACDSGTMLVTRDHAMQSDVRVCCACTFVLHTLSPSRSQCHWPV